MNFGDILILGHWLFCYALTQHIGVIDKGGYFNLKWWKCMCTNYIPSCLNETWNRHLIAVMPASVFNTIWTNRYLNLFCYHMCYKNICNWIIHLCIHPSLHPSIQLLIHPSLHPAIQWANCQVRWESGQILDRSPVTRERQPITLKYTIMAKSGQSLNKDAFALWAFRFYCKIKWN